MTRPRRTPPDELAKVREIIARVKARTDWAAPHRRIGVRGGTIHSAPAAGMVTDDGRCARCGRLVERINAEPLDVEPTSKGRFDVKSLVYVLLPCGDAFTKRVDDDEATQVE